MNTKAIGDKGEDLSAAYLQKHGYEILERQYRKLGGEIDIIAQKDDCLVFCEVKARSSLQYGRPAEAVSLRKQQRIIHTATCYLQENNLEDIACRFDVIEIYHKPEGDFLQHLKNAFEAG